VGGQLQIFFGRNFSHSQFFVSCPTPELQLSPLTTSTVLSHIKIQNGDVLVLADQDASAKWPLRDWFTVDSQLSLFHPALYIRPGNGVGIFLQPGAHTGLVHCEVTAWGSGDLPNICTFPGQTYPAIQNAAEELYFIIQVSIPSRFSAKAYGRYLAQLDVGRKLYVPV